MYNAVTVELKPRSYLEPNVTHSPFFFANCKDGDELHKRALIKLLEWRRDSMWSWARQTDHSIGLVNKWDSISLHLSSSHSSTIWFHHMAHILVTIAIDTAERERRLQASHFDCVAAIDVLNNILHQWKDVQPLDDLNLVHKINSCTREGG